MSREAGTAVEPRCVVVRAEASDAKARAHELFHARQGDGDTVVIERGEETMWCVAVERAAGWFLYAQVGSQDLVARFVEGESQALIEVDLGGDRTKWPATVAVPRALAMRAVDRFIEARELVRDDGLRWDDFYEVRR